MPHWFDVGVNLTDKRLSDDCVLTDAIAADVMKMAVTGTDLVASQSAVALCHKHPQSLVCTVGIHPHYAKDTPEDFIDQLRLLAQDQSVVAIGECGLDFNRNFSEPAIQLSVFEQQLALASELKLPVFLHERDAFDEQMRLLQAYRNDLVGGVAHCFTGNIEQMQAYLELGFYIGITGWLCDEKRGHNLRDAVCELPIERLVLETDAPYLKPKTLKSSGRDNFPANLPHIAEQLAKIKQVDVHELKVQVWHNSLSLFNLLD